MRHQGLAIYFSNYYAEHWDARIGAYGTGQEKP